MTGLSVDLSPELVEAIALRAAELVAREPEPRWLSGCSSAAAYLDWKVKRVHNKMAEIPHYRNGGLVMFRTDELDRYAKGDL